MTSPATNILRETAQHLSLALRAANMLGLTLDIRALTDDELAALIEWLNIERARRKKELAA